MSFDPVSAIVGLADTVITRIFPDPAEAAKAKLELFRLQQSGELAQMTGQMEINKVEAANGSTFVSGWRPAIGWICGAACAWNWIGLPVTKMILLYSGTNLEIATADLSEMMPILMGMLGLGAMRTYERLNGVIPKGK